MARSSREIAAELVEALQREGRSGVISLEVGPYYGRPTHQVVVSEGMLKKADAIRISAGPSGLPCPRCGGAGVV